jgi:hypothetical protein
MSGVTSTDHGYDALVTRVFGFGHPVIEMGILEKDGAKAKTEREGEESDEALTIIDVANMLEFGTEDAPARSIIREWFDTASPEMRRDLSKLMQSVIKGTRTKDEILEILGLRAQGEIQQRMADGIDPPNAPSTIKAKGSSKPTIDTGQTRSAVSYAVREK